MTSEHQYSDTEEIVNDALDYDTDSTLSELSSDLGNRDTSTSSLTATPSEASNRTRSSKSRVITLKLGARAESRSGRNSSPTSMDLDEDDDDFEVSSSGKKKKGKGKRESTSKKRSSLAMPKASTSGVTQIPMPTEFVEMEKILYYRPSSDLEDRKEEEFLVKFKNRSYLHCEWVTRSWIETNDKRAKQRIKHFLEKTMADLAYNLLSEDRPFSENYVKIDKIISEVPEYPDPFTKIMYKWFLVKWTSLPYESCTWETTETLLAECDDAEEQIELFRKRNALPHVRDPDFYKNYVPPGVRLPPSSWNRIEESPIYKDQFTLRPYQLEGLNWLLYCWHHGQSSLIADEMGLGKTVQSITFLNELYTKKGVKGPFLIIAPLSTIPHWERTVSGWTDMNCVVFHGSASSRNIIQNYEYHYIDVETGKKINLVAPPEMMGKTNVNALRAAYNQFKFDIMITTYEMAMSAPSAFKNVGLWRVVVVDEAHRLKNKASKVGEVLKTFSFEHRLLLTGTPIQNSLEELWSILNFLDSKKFPDGSERQFLTEFDLQSAADVQRLQEILKPLMLRRLKEDVEKSIPVKEETIIEVELTDIQRAYYRAILERNFLFLKQGAKRNNVPNLINTMMELRKCCIHPYLLKGAEEKVMEDNKAVTPQQQFDCMVQASGKLVLLNKLLPKLQAGGHRILIFSQMTRCLDLLGDYLRGKGYLYERIDGTVRGESRQAAIDRFSAPESNIFAFLLCTRAGGVGINLTAADTCIIFDSDWNPQNDLQAQARCHRIGQKKDVKIYRLITRNTYERTMFDKAGMKLGLDRAVLSKMDFDAGDGSSASGSGAPSSLSKTEIEELLRKGAYAAVMNEGDEENDESKKFCEEDIDSILQRRSQTIRHGDDAESEKIKNEGSLFSKATFSLEGNLATNLDVNDPEFWDKWAQKANIDTNNATAIDDTAKLIISDSRRRRTRTDIDDDGKSFASDDEGRSSFGERKPHRWAKEATGCTPWSMAEKIRIERGLMAHGFGGWEKKKEQFPKRSISDIKAVEIRLIQWCLAKLRKERELVTEKKDMNDLDEEQTAKAKNRAREDLRAQREDIRMFADVERAISCVRWEIPTLADIETMAAGNCHDKFSPVQYEIEKHEELGVYPYPEATFLQLLDYRSFLDDCSRDYFDHLEKKPRNILTRVQSMHFIREHILDVDLHATADIWIASELYEKETGHLPESNTSAWIDKYISLFQARRSTIKFADTYSQVDESTYLTIPGWGFDEDRDLFMGMVKYGYLSFDKIRDDPSLIFKQKNYISTDIAKKNPELAHTCPIWPNGSDVGQRLRRVISLLSRHVRDTRPTLQGTSDSDAILNDHCWGKKDRSEYLRAVNSIGLPELEEMEVSREEAEKCHYRIIDSRNGKGDLVVALKRNWNIFRENGQLDQKSDYALEQFARAFVRRAEEFVRTSSDKGLTGDMCVSGRIYGEPLPDNVFDQYPEPEVPLIDLVGGSLDPCSGMALERARRLLRRIVFMRTIRAQVLKDSNLDFKLTFAKRSSGLPDWWIPGAHDKAFLQGVARYGMTPLRQNHIMFDPDLPFRPIVEEKLKAAGYGDKLESLIKQSTLTKHELNKKSSATAGDDDGDNDDDEGGPASSGDVNLEEVVGWPKDLIRSRRVEIVMDLVVNPSHKAMNMLNYFGKDSKRKAEDTDIGNEMNMSRRIKRIRNSASGVTSQMLDLSQSVPLDENERNIIEKSLQQLKDTISFIESNAQSRELVEALREFVHDDTDNEDHPVADQLNGEAVEQMEESIETEMDLDQTGDVADEI